jgi:D-alanyl-D-alanine carboxypeptidase (penicillin-binding protein 5/6)
MGIIIHRLTARLLLLFILLPAGPTLAGNWVRMSDQDSGSRAGGRPLDVVPDLVIPRATSRGTKTPSPESSSPRSLSSWAFEHRLTAKSAIVTDARTGRTLYARCPNVPRQPASTIKVLTGLIALERLKTKAMVSISRRAARMPRSKVYLRRGRSYRAGYLINAVLLASANDASVALAEKIAGSEWAFAKIMTRRARLLGARKTVCKTASGLTRRGQKSTVRDLGVIFRQAMKNSALVRRMGIKRLRTTRGKVLKNHNKALWRVPGARAGKTGYTRAAGQTYVGAFVRGQDELIVAIMGSKTMWRDIRNLLAYGFEKKRRLRAAAHQWAPSQAALNPSGLH